MRHNCTKNNKINRLHERYLSLIYNKKSSFEELLEIDSSVSIHDRNLRALAVEMYKIYHGISPTIMNEIFILRHQKASIILYVGQILMFQKLQLLIMVLRVLDISVLRFGKLYQNILKG